MSAPAAPADKIPLPVRHALAALAILRGEDSALAQAVQKILPGYAKVMAGRGETVTVESLLIDARRGTDFLKNASARPDAASEKDFFSRYSRIVAHLPSADSDEPAINAARKGDIETLAAGEKEYHPIRINNLLNVAAENGQTKTVAWLLDRWPISKDHALIGAARKGHLETISLLLDRGADIDAYQGGAIIGAARHGQSAAVGLLLDRCPDVSSRSYRALYIAAVCGHTDTVALVLDKGGDIHTNSDEALVVAAQRGWMDTVSLLIDRGADIHAKNSRALRNAVEHGHHDVVALLLDRGADIQGLKDIQLLNQRPAPTVALMIDLAATTELLSERQKSAVTLYRQYAAGWQKTVHCYPPHLLEKRDPRVFKPALFSALRRAFVAEGLFSIANTYAYNTMALFQSEERVLHYLQKWGQDAKQPLHDITQMIDLPNDLGHVNLADWGDAVLKHGLQMARLVKFCDKLPSPLKSDDGKTWSYSKTRAEIAKHAFARAAEHPALAALCFEHAMKEESFNRALDLVQQPIKIKALPEITIDGERFDMAGATFKKLANDDVRGLFLGELTDCCQSIGGAGEKCATHGFTSPQGGFYVVETAKGEIIGQSWAWRGTKGELCFDSLETLGRRISDAQWKKILEAAADELDLRHDHNVDALHVGLSGKTPKTLREQFRQAVARPADYNGSRDSIQQIRVWKRWERQP